MDRAAQHSGYRFPTTAVGNTGQSSAASQHENLAGQMRYSARSAMCTVDLARIRLAVVYKLFGRLPRRRGKDDQNQKSLRELDDRNKVFDGIVSGARGDRWDYRQRAGVAD